MSLSVLCNCLYELQGEITFHRHIVVFFVTFHKFIIAVMDWMLFLLAKAMR